jgi:SAM-dependent methyltransferase
MSGTSTVNVDPSNATALRAWDGAEGDWWVENEVLYDESLARYDARFLDAAGIAAGDRVLDVGCGTGKSTRDAARRATPGIVLGVDLSSKMLDLARRRAAEHGIENARFEQADAQVHPFGPQSFDVAMSRTGTMFFGDVVSALANIGRALRPGGRLTQLVWQPFPENPWVVELDRILSAGRTFPQPPPDAPGPFSLSDPERVRRVLAAAGFADAAFDDARELIQLGADTEDGLRWVLGLGWTRSMFKDLDDEARSRAVDSLRAMLAAHDTGDGVLYDSACWIITATRP